MKPFMLICLALGMHWLSSQRIGAFGQPATSAPTPANATANSGTLAVVILLTNIRYKDSDRLEMLRGSIRLACKHLFPTTPCAMYVFTLRTALPALEAGLGGLLKGDGAPPGPPVQLLPVPDHAWRLPEAATNSSYWTGHWNADYRLMGHWRLSYMPEFARARGHRYVLQLDDDSYITSRVPNNLVELFDTRGYQMGAVRLTHEPELIGWGLPELTKYFLLTYGVKPTTLFEHCRPPDFTGLYSAVAKDWDLSKKLGDLGGELEGKVPTEGGWDRLVPNGNCVMVSLDWWFQPLVQRFVKLCLDSGGAVMHRWNDQAVLGMAAHVFIPAGKYHNFTFGYIHKGKTRDALRAGGLS